MNAATTTPRCIHHPARELFGDIASGLWAAREEIAALIANGQDGTRAVALLALVSNVGEAADMACEALGGGLVSDDWRNGLHTQLDALRQRPEDAE